MWEHRARSEGARSAGGGGGLAIFLFVDLSVIGACSISHVTLSTRDRLSRPSLIPVDARETGLEVVCKFTHLPPPDE